jgi:hypothetical protein
MTGLYQIIIRKLIGPEITMRQIMERVAIRSEKLRETKCSGSDEALIGPGRFVDTLL